MLNCTLHYAFTSNYITLCVSRGEGSEEEILKLQAIVAKEEGKGKRETRRRAINEMKHGRQPSDRGEHCNLELDVSGFCVKADDTKDTFNE
jgi:hypothetical protein